MLKNTKQLRDVPRIETDIMAHILCDRSFFHAKIINLACWGARIKSSHEMKVHDTLGVNFVFFSDYFISAQVVEKLQDEYRIKFIFTDLGVQESLCGNVFKHAKDRKLDL